MKKVMIVDDEQDIRETVKTVLEKNNYSVIEAENADDCLKKLKNEKIDLIIMDIMMPGTPVREIIPKIKNTKIIYLSIVKTTEAEKEKLIGKNVIDFIQKPFDIEELLEKIKKILS